MIDSAVIGAQISAVSALGATTPEDRLAKCLETNTPYIDLEFPPVDSSWNDDLEGERNDSAIGCAPPPPNWKRPAAWLPPRAVPVLLEDDIPSPNNIVQGELGTCYFLAALSCTCRRREWIAEALCLDLAPSRKEQQVGAWRVSLWFGGKRHRYILDDCFPVNQHGKRIGARSAVASELWVSLLEKAWARCHGSYVASEGGDALEALSQMTLAPMWRVHPTDINIGLVIDELRQGSMVVVGTPDDDEIATPLEPGHSYAVVFQAVDTGCATPQLLDPRQQEQGRHHAPPVLAFEAHQHSFTEGIGLCVSRCSHAPPLIVETFIKAGTSMSHHALLLEVKEMTTVIVSATQSTSHKLGLCLRHVLMSSRDGKATKHFASTTNPLAPQLDKEGRLYAAASVGMLLHLSPSKPHQQQFLVLTTTNATTLHTVIIAVHSPTTALSLQSIEVPQTLLRTTSMT